MRKHFLIPTSVLLLSVLVAACASQPVVQTAWRGIASFEEWRNPETGLLYVDEAREYERQVLAGEFKIDTLWGFYQIDPAIFNSKKFSKDFKQMAITLRWVRTNPIAVFHSIRNSREPIKSLAPLPIENPAHPVGRTYLVTKYKDVQEAFDKKYYDEKEKREKHVYTVRNYNKKIRDFMKGNEKEGSDFMLSTDDDPRLNGAIELWNNPNYRGDEKLWMRSILTREDIEKRVRPLLRNNLIPQAIREGTYTAKRVNGQPYNRIELVSRVARRVPVLLTQQYFGLTASEDQLLKWSRAAQFEMFHNVKNDARIAQDSVEAGREMQVFVDQLIKERREQIKREPNKYNDILTQIIKLADSGKIDGFDDSRVRVQIIGTLIGNVETSEAAIVQALEVLFQYPDARDGAIEAARRGDMKLLEGYIWEALRFNPVNPFVIRYAERTANLGKDPNDPNKPGLSIPAGSLVLLATHSAMMDPEMYPRPHQIDPTRHIAPNAAPEYYHLGDKYHRCLGDIVSKVQIPEIIRAILLLEDVAPVRGLADERTNPLEFSDKGKISKIGGTHREEGGFPERFHIEYKAKGEAKEFQLVDPAFAYEDYLMDFNRDDYRMCLSKLFDPKWSPEQTVVNIMGNIANHKDNDYKHALLFCRLPKKFTDCMDRSRILVKFNKYTKNDFHVSAFNDCSNQAQLNETQVAFYRQIFFHEPIRDFSRLKVYPRGNNGWEYEDHLKFYDRYTYRECLMNPQGWKSFPQAEKMLFYARLPIAFRMCMGVPVTLKVKEVMKQNPNANEEEVTLAARRERFQLCRTMQPAWDPLKKKNDSGVDPVSGKREGILTADEQYYYQKLILNENPPVPGKIR